MKNTCKATIYVARTYYKHFSKQDMTFISSTLVRHKIVSRYSGHYKKNYVKLLIDLLEFCYLVVKIYSQLILLIDVVFVCNRLLTFLLTWH